MLIVNSINLHYVSYDWLILQQFAIINLGKSGAQLNLTAGATLPCELPPYICINTPATPHQIYHNKNRTYSASEKKLGFCHEQTLFYRRKTEFLDE